MPAQGFANRARAVRKLARPALSPVCQELAARGAERFSATMKRGTGLSQMPQGLWREPQRSAERRARLSARRAPRSRGGAPCQGAAVPDAGEGCDALWVSARIRWGASVGAPPPFTFGRQSFVLCNKTRARIKTAPRERDCFVSGARRRKEGVASIARQRCDGFSALRTVLGSRAMTVR